MKYKFFIILFVCLACFLIYRVNYKNEKYLLALGDSSCLATSVYGAVGTSYNFLLYKHHLVGEYNDSFCQKNLKISDLVKKIMDNSGQVQYFLDKSDYITIMIGYDELTNYKQISNIEIRDFITNYSKLVKLLKKYTKGKVIVIGFYPNYFSNYKTINLSLERLCLNNNITFINTDKVINYDTDFYDNKHFELNNNGEQKIFKLIKEKL